MAEMVVAWWKVIKWWKSMVRLMMHMTAEISCIADHVYDRPAPRHFRKHGWSTMSSAGDALGITAPLALRVCRL